MRVLALTRYGRTGASSRLRFMQYLPYLKSADIHVEVSSLFSDAYVQGLQLGHRSAAHIVSGYVKRAYTLCRSSDFDLLWIEKDALPWLPAPIERAMFPSKTPFVLDYDDAVFHSYDQHSSNCVRQLLADKHSDLMQGAALVVAGNEYLAKFAQQSGTKHIEIVPTVIDLKRYPIPIFDQLAVNTIPCVGWIGQRSTAPFLSQLATVFQKLITERSARFVAIGIDADSFGLPMSSVPWTENTEVASICNLDIGIMPLVDEPFARGKCGYKLIQYMACGLPVVASPVGVNCQIVEHGVNGFLADTPDDWLSALRALATDPDMRKRMGQAGRRKVEQEYCLQVTGYKLAELLKSAASLNGK